MEQHKLWRNLYRSHRYLEHKDNTYIYQRIGDILNIFMILNEKGQLAAHKLDDKGAYLIQKFTDAHEELVLRKGWPPTEEMKKHLHFPEASYPMQPLGWNNELKENSKNNNYLFKFGSRSYLQDMLDFGKMRISPASMYDDPSLNSAIRDEELKLTVEYYPSDVMISYYDPRRKESVGVHPVSNLIKTVEASTNYYVYCVSTDYKARFFKDFSADSCLIIKDADRFVKTLAKAFYEKISKEWNGYAGLVKYIDPLFPVEDIDIFFSKDFKYLYQSEFRFVWFPPKAEKNLDSVFVNLGNINDYCELNFPK